MRDLQQTQMDSEQRAVRAEADARQGGSRGDQAGHTPGAFRCGVARIVSNGGSGAYTITEQWHDTSDPPEWTDAVGPGVLVAAAARDFGDCEDGEADQLVLFWQQRKGGGQIETLLSVPRPGEALERLEIAYHWKDDGEPNPTENVATIDERDWRRYWVRIMGHCSYGPPSGMNDNDKCKVPTAGGNYQHFHKVDDVDYPFEYAYWGIGHALLQWSLFVDGTDGGKLKLRFKNLSGQPAEMSFYAIVDVYRTSTPTTDYTQVGDNH